MEWVESTGKTIDEAKNVALDRLGVHEDDAEFDIVADVKVGLFGRVKEEARVRARVRPTTPRAKDDRNRRSRGGRGQRRGRDGQRQKGQGRGGDQQGQRQKGQGQGNKKQGNKKQGGRQDGGQQKSSKQEGQRSRANGRSGNGRDNRGGGSDNGDQHTSGGRPNDTSGGARGDEDRGDRRDETRSGKGRQSRENSVNEDEPMMPLTQQADIAEAFVAGLAERFGADVTFERTDVEEDIHLTVTGADLGRMIGRRGSTALAIDELVRTVLQRQAGSSRNGRIRVDIGGVRARRTEALTQFCQQLAAQVRETGVEKALEPMGAADRKTVHDVINDEPGVDTISEGEDPNRRVVIVPVGDAD